MDNDNWPKGDPDFDNFLNLSRGVFITIAVVGVIVLLGALATCITLPIVLCGLCPCCHCCPCCKNRSYNRHYYGETHGIVHQHYPHREEN